MKQLMPKYSEKKLAKASEILKMISENPTRNCEKGNYSLQI